MVAGDSVSLEWTEDLPGGGQKPKETLLVAEVDHALTIDECGIFWDKSEDGKDMLCGAFMGKKI